MAPPDAALPDAALTRDAFLGGRLMLLQPRRGYRAATDPVLLAAACNAQPGALVLDAGCGVGAAGLCLSVRTAGLDLHGLELQPKLAALARRNAQENGLSMQIHEGDLAKPPAAIKARIFDHVITNPPFFADADPPSPQPSRDIARRETALDLRGWIHACLRRLRQGGWLTVIHRTERLPALLLACEGRAGSITVRPLAARQGRAAGRVLLQARKDSRGPFVLAAPLMLHEGVEHGTDGDDFSSDATAVLRDAAPLPITGAPAAPDQRRMITDKARQSDA